MTQLLPIFAQNYYSYIVPDFEDDEDIDLEEGFIETDEDEDEENIEWIWEEEVETEVDGPSGPTIIKKGRYTEML